VFLFLTFSLIFALLLACEDEKGTLQPQEIFEIKEITLPEVISSTSGRAVLISAMVTHPDGNQGIDNVLAIFNDTLGQSQLILELFDDGDSQNKGSGDIIAFDHIYTTFVVGNQLGLPDGKYRILIQALDTNKEVKESQSSDINIFPNLPPEILNFSFPDSIQSGMNPTQAFFTVDDNDGLNDVLWVIIEGFQQGNPFPAFVDTVYNPLNNSPVFSFPIDSVYGAGKEGNYELIFFAEDRVGDLSSQEIQNLFVENTPPKLLSILVPDTIIIPLSGFNLDTVRAVVDDSQSLLDINSVSFFSQIRESGGSLGDPSNPIELFDNGDIQFSGDQAAKDGIYSRIISIGPTNTAGTYIFTFEAKDLVDQLSNVLVDSIIVVNQ
jgi:hypothetical protein